MCISRSSFAYSCYLYHLFLLLFSFFFFNDTATTEIYTLSLHDALPIFGAIPEVRVWIDEVHDIEVLADEKVSQDLKRSEEHTSELQSPYDLVCRLLLEKKKNKIIH